MSKYKMDSDVRAHWVGIMQLLIWQAGPTLGEDCVRDTMYEMMAKPGGASLDELCAKFGMTLDDRKEMGFPFFVANPRRHVVFTRPNN